MARVVPASAGIADEGVPHNPRREAARKRRTAHPFAPRAVNGGVRGR